MIVLVGIQFKQLLSHTGSLKKISCKRGFEPITSAMPEFTAETSISLDNSKLKVMMCINVLEYQS